MTDSGKDIKELLKLKFVPTKEQQQIIEFPLVAQGVPQPLLVVAGAGSGKTATMSTRAAYAVATRQVDAGQILGLTFTRKAAAELREKLVEAIPKQSSDELDFGQLPVSTTYNAFALGVVQEFGSLIGLPTNLVHMDSAASWQLMNDIVQGWTEPLPERSMNTLTEDALRLREDIANQGMDVATARRRLEQMNSRFDLAIADHPRGPKMWISGQNVNNGRLLLLGLIEEFDRRKAETGRTDFADQVLMATRIVKESPHIVATLRERHRAVFLDEFQDTSVAQMEFLAQLFHDHPVTAVGDPNQAIYGWRGASAGALDDFHLRFSRHADTERSTLCLSTSWRNAKRILEVANSVADPLRVIAKKRKGIESPKLEPMEEALLGDVSVDYELSENEQITRIADFVEHARSELEGKNGSIASVAVLCRRRSLIPLVLQAVRDRGIPAETVGADGLLFHPAVADLRAYLRASTDIGDSPALLRLLIKLRLGTDDLWKLGRLASRCARGKTGERSPALLSEAIDRVEEADLSEAGTFRVRRLAAQLQELRGVAGWSIVDQIARARIISGLERDAVVTGEHQQVAEVLDTLTNFAASYQDSNPHPTMQGFLSWLEAAEAREGGLSLPHVQPDPNAVQVMTVHASKGLEWDAVAVADLELTAFPSYRSPKSAKKVEDEWVSPLPESGIPGQKGWWEDYRSLPYPIRGDAEVLPHEDIWSAELKATAAGELLRQDIGAYLLAEERRLAYVAFTRARMRLGLFGSWLGSGATPRYPSMFLMEASKVTGVVTYIHPSPQEEELIKEQRALNEYSFPEPPDNVTKALQSSAWLVREERKAPASTRSAALAQLGSELSKDIEALLSERTQIERYRSLDLERRSATDVLAAVADSDWTFSATQLPRLVGNEGLWMELRRPLPQKPGHGAVIGTAFHQWVETTLRRAAADDLEAEDYPQLGLSEKDLVILKRLQQNFASLAWIHDASAIALEVPFSFAHQGVLLRGRIDAVLEVPGQSEQWLIDWKTGRAPSDHGNDSRLVDYLVQLGTYVLAWQDNTTAPLRAQLVFLGDSAPQVVTLEALEDAYLHRYGKPWDLLDALSTFSDRLRQVPGA